MDGAQTVPEESRPPRLIDQVRAAIRRRHYSLRTEDAYIGWIKRFIYFQKKRHPAQMGEPEVTAYLNHLAVGERLTACEIILLHAELSGFLQSRFHVRQREHRELVVLGTARNETMMAAQIAQCARHLKPQIIQRAKWQERMFHA